MSFFELFPSFEPDPKASIKKEFDRLAQQQNWPKEVAERFRAVCYEDELADFSVAQGLTTPLKKLQMLCAELCVEDIPPSINKCKEVRFDSMSKRQDGNEADMRVETGPQQSQGQLGRLNECSSSGQASSHLRVVQGSQQVHQKEEDVLPQASCQV